MHMPAAPHVCEPMTLIRAVEGLTPRGRPPLHSRDGHSQPVNPPRCKSHRQRATECGTHKEMTATQWLQIWGMQACKKTNTHTQIHILVIFSPPCLQRDSSWPARLSVTLMRLFSYVQILCPPSFTSPPKLSLFSLSQLKDQQRQKITRRNQIIPTVIYTDVWWFHKKALQGGIHLTRFLKLTDYYVL